MAALRPAPQVIVLGAGLAGLTAAAHLARRGKAVLLLEREAHWGGCCATRRIDGMQFDVGANYFGRHLLNIFRGLGVPRPFAAVPIRGRGAIGNACVTHPFGPHSVGEFFQAGLGAGDLIALLGRLYGQLLLDVFGRADTAQQIIDRVAAHPLLAEFFNMEALLLGSRSDLMPSYLFNVIFGTEYGFDHPFYPAGGSSDIPDALARIIQAHGGEIRTGCAVEAIVMEQGRVRGVQVDGQRIACDTVVSSLGLAATTACLGDAAPPAMRSDVARVRRGLRFATMFMAVDPGAADAPGVHTLVASGADLRHAMAGLFAGQMPPQIPFVLTCPPQARPRADGLRPAVLRFPLPEAFPSDEALLRRVAQEVVDGLDTFVPGFVERIAWARLFSPIEFRRAFGFEACYSPQLEIRKTPRLENVSPLPGLFLAGAGVGARGVHTGSAMESGRRCARAVEANIKKEARI